MEVASGGASLAWRLLATLEGGSLVLAASALLAFTARGRRRRRRDKRRVRSVLLTNTTSDLGSELKHQLEARGCTVSTVTSGAEPQAEAEFDALVVVGKETTVSNLDGMADLVAEDVYSNLKTLDTWSRSVRPGGRVSWVRRGAGAGAYRGAADALDAALKAGLQHTAKARGCEAVWISGSGSVADTSARCVAALQPLGTEADAIASHAHSVRNAATKVSSYVGRWLKIVR